MFKISKSIIYCIEYCATNGVITGERLWTGGVGTEQRKVEGSIGGRAGHMSSDGRILLHCVHRKARPIGVTRASGPLHFDADLVEFAAASDKATNITFQRRNTATSYLTASKCCSEVYMYCTAAAQSTRTCNILALVIFTRVYHAWKHECTSC